MEKKYTKIRSITDMIRYKKARDSKRAFLSLVFELTPRCNNRCLHCYINHGEEDNNVKSKELSFDQILRLIDDAFKLGVLWIVFTGGEPLLREDFLEIYKYCKKKGMLVSFYSNATLITENHITVLKKYRPRDIEITVYGVTQKTYGRVTGRPDLFEKSIQGIKRLKDANLPLTLKTTVLKANFNEFEKISDFCKNNSDNIFRFDPFLHLRLDKDPQKNKIILSQRLSVEDILKLERSDKERFAVLEKKCIAKNTFRNHGRAGNRILKCRAGIDQCYIDYKGMLKLCHFLSSRQCTYDLLNGSLEDAWYNFVPGVRTMESEDSVFLEKCNICNIRDLCMWCPAHSDLAVSRLDGFNKEYCMLAHKRFDSTKKYL